MVRAVGFAIEQARSEGILVQAWEESFLPTLMRVMLPRMSERGVAREGEIDLDTLARSIDQERREADSTIFWNVAFLVPGRFEGTR